MCDKDRLVAYLYDDLGDAERAAFDRHLRECADCRDELNALRGVRADLISWSPPQPDFGFRVVREPKVVPMPPRTWRAWYTPAAGLAAAAVLVLAAASAIARVEIHSGPDGVTVRTGWPSSASSASAPENNQRFGETAASRQAVRGDVVLPSSMSSEVDASMIAMLDRRLRALETASRQPAVVRNASLTTGPGGLDPELVRRMREMLAQSEAKQQVELARRINQVIGDFEAQRVADLSRIQTGLRNVEAAVSATEAVQRESTNYILTRSGQK